MISIVMPAHNEERVIARSVEALTAGKQPGEFELIVVCNGCTDRTAAVVREFGDSVRVIETEVGSKVNALNLGDAASAGFPRFYVDADVVLQRGAIEKIAAALKQPGIFAASPQVRHDFANTSWAVRAFYRIDRSLPSSRDAIGGSGVYALSEAGRQRFGKFPEIVGDDAFVKRHFNPSERFIVNDAVSTVTPPESLAGLITIKARSHYGNYELAEKFPNLTASRGASNRNALLKLAINPLLWPSLAVYAYVKIRARLRAKRNWASRAAYVWERDETSRRATE